MPAVTPCVVIITSVASFSDAARWAAFASPKSTIFVVLHAVILEHPEWRNTYDSDGAEAAATRQRFLDDVASTHTLVLAYHFADFPSLGYVKRNGTAWVWVPVR